MKYQAEVVGVSKLNGAVRLHLQWTGAPCRDSETINYDNNFFWYLPTDEAKARIGSRFTVTIEPEEK